MSTPRRANQRFLTAEQKYDLWQRMLTGQITTVAAAAEAGVDRSTVMAFAQDGQRRGDRRPAGVPTGPPQGGSGRGVRARRPSGRGGPAIGHDRGAGGRVGGPAGKAAWG